MMSQPPNNQDIYGESYHPSFEPGAPPPGSEEYTSMNMDWLLGEEIDPGAAVVLLALGFIVGAIVGHNWRSRPGG